MSATTAIEWTERTWNPTTGCDRVSPGCANCYAMEMAKRLKALGRPEYQKDGGPASGPGFGLTMHPERLSEPLSWRKPSLVFVDSMSDLFHEEVTDEFLDRVFAVMALTPQHTYQVLTKRPERMLDWHRTGVMDARWVTVEGQAHRLLHDRGWPDERLVNVSIKLPLPNVWLGVSAENQRMLDERVPLLLETPAAVRFVSCEPLLGPLDFTRVTPRWDDRWGSTSNVLSVDYPTDTIYRSRIDWVIVGGESGAMSTRGGPGRALVERCDRHNVDSPTLRPPCSRCGRFGDESGNWAPKPEALEWVRSIRDQCESAGVPMFFKQWPIPPHKPGGPALIDGREWRQMP